MVSCNGGGVGDVGDVAQRFQTKHFIIRVGFSPPDLKSAVLFLV